MRKIDVIQMGLMVRVVWRWWKWGEAWFGGDMRDCDMES